MINTLQELSQGGAPTTPVVLQLNMCVDFTQDSQHSLYFCLLGRGGSIGGQFKLLQCFVGTNCGWEHRECLCSYCI